MRATLPARVALALVLALALAACGKGGGAHHDPTRDEAWHADLRRLGRELPAHHVAPFAHVAEADFRRAIAELDAAVSRLDDAHLTTGIARIVAMIGDSHTTVQLPPHPTYPLAFLDFGDGYHVVAAPDEARWAIGRRLIAIDGHAAASAASALATVIAHDNDVWLHARISALLADPVLLAGLDLVRDPAHATFTLIDPDDDAGDTRELVLAPGGHAQVALPPSPPLWLQKTDLPYWNTWLDGEHLLYLQYNRCADGPTPFARFAAETLAFIDQHDVARLVIDLRHNGGGNSEIIRPLVEGIAKRPRLTGRVFAIIGPQTFSSAMLNALTLRRGGATLVGMPTGGNPNSLGEVKELLLGHLTIGYSTKRFTADDNPGDTVMPGLVTPLSAADWAAGRDPALDAIRAAPVTPLSPPGAP